MANSEGGAEWSESVSPFMKSVIQLVDCDNKATQVQLFKLLGYDCIKRYLANFVEVIPESQPEYKSECLSLVSYLVQHSEDCADKATIRVMHKRLTLSATLGLLKHRPVSVSDQIAPLVRAMSADIHSSLTRSDPVYHSHGNEMDMLDFQLSVLRLHWTDRETVRKAAESVHNLVVMSGAESGEKKTVCLEVLKAQSFVQSFAKCVVAHLGDRPTVNALLSCAMLFVEGNPQATQAVFAADGGFMFAVDRVHEAYKHDPRLVAHLDRLRKECAKNDDSGAHTHNNSTSVFSIGMRDRLSAARGVRSGDIKSVENVVFDSLLDVNSLWFVDLRKLFAIHDNHSSVGGGSWQSSLSKLFRAKAWPCLDISNSKEPTS
eukprot:gene34202-42171_t